MVQTKPPTDIYVGYWSRRFI